MPRLSHHNQRAVRQIVEAHLLDPRVLDPVPALLTAGLLADDETTTTVWLDDCRGDVAHAHHDPGAIVGRRMIYGTGQLESLDSWRIHAAERALRPYLRGEPSPEHAGADRS